MMMCWGGLAHAGKEPDFRSGTPTDWAGKVRTGEGEFEGLSHQITRGGTRTRAGDLGGAIGGSFREDGSRSLVLHGACNSPFEMELISCTILKMPSFPAGGADE